MELFCLQNKRGDIVKNLPIFAAISFFFIIFSIIPAVHADSANTEKTVIYETNFSTDPGWTTNNPSRYYWNAEKAGYHYLEEGGTGGYAFFPIDYNGESFSFEFNITPMITDNGAVMDIGIGTEDMDVTHGTVVLFELSWKKFGKIMGLKVITPDNHLYESKSNHLSYGGETVTFEDNKTYNVIIQYSKQQKTISIKVLDGVTNDFVWGYYVQISTNINYLNRIMLSSVGNYDSSGVTSEGYIGNVSLTVFRPAVQVQTSATTIPATTEEYQTPEMTSTETPLPSTPVTTQETTTTKAGPESLIICSEIVFASLLLFWLRQ